MEALNLPPADVKVKTENGSTKIFDIVRKKWLVLTPEEWVRQHFIHYLINDKGYPASLMTVEAGLKYNQMAKRTDIVVHDRNGNPLMVVECKSPKVKVSQDAFDQAARYNMTLKVKYLVVTNGLKNYCCFIDHEKGEYAFLEEVPEYTKA